jgi:hypothetical protein
MLFVCISLLVAPILGVVAASAMPNPPGNGPGGWQVVFGVAVPVLLTRAAASVARVTRIHALMLAVSSVAATGALVLLLVWFVGTHSS